ncbi:uncharacterized protein LOC130690463 [Daphnia carinata]|uniref:uncharacterized protein LOC130690463 n=1 Tax=Daphnia carinata TaxID=120202 RepID=UPI002579FEEC|nr:uncharacterized protein LOC130690463 [Daphnia carinata]
MRPKYHSFLHLVLLCAMVSLTAAQFGNSSTDFLIWVPEERDENNVTIVKRLSWQEASEHCNRLNGGFPRENHFNLLLDSSVWTAGQPIWIGLSWIEGRLQWMGHVPMEELNMTVIQYYAERRFDTNKLCYSMDQNKAIAETSCHQRLPYVCVMVEGDEVKDRPPSPFAFVNEDNYPYLIPNGDHPPAFRSEHASPNSGGEYRSHPPFLVIKPSSEKGFNLSCEIIPIEMSGCLQYQYRWLRNGAFKSEFDGNVSISDSNIGFGSGEAALLAKTLWWTLNWIGKVACEIVCVSLGKAYRSKEHILVLPQSVSLRVEFQLKMIHFSAVQTFFEMFMQPELRNQTGIPSHQLPVFHLDYPPFLSYPDNSTNTYSFYVHWASMDPNGTRKLSLFLRNISHSDSFSYWMSLDDGVGREYDRYFQSIQVIMLNYCINEETDPTLVFANQATLSRKSDSNYRDEDLDECLYAARQCKADWFNSTRFDEWKTSSVCLNCMASFHDFEGRCLKFIKPLPFSKSIAQCMAEYQIDEVDELWEMSEWIRLAFYWIDENKNSGTAKTLDFNQLWIPVQRRTNLGPLRPVWPWTNFKEEEGPVESSWDEELQNLVDDLGLLADWSKLNASLNCLKLDIKTRTLESALCTENIPMVCIRPRLKSTYSIVSINSTVNFTRNGQCPLGWLTSTLIAERNYCFKLFGGVEATFDEAELECRKRGGDLAVAPERSTSAVLLDMFKTCDMWIGLKRTSDGYKWIDNSNWTYQHQVDWKSAVAVIGQPEEPGNAISLHGYRLSSNRIMAFWQPELKETRLSSFLCQQEIVPQRQLTLQMKLDTVFRPFVSIQPIPLHLREIHRQPEIHNRTLLEESQPREITDDEPPSLSLLTCFLGNSTFTANYSTLKEISLNYSLISNAGTRNVSLMEWRAIETSCETWDEWSTENLKTSSIISHMEHGFFSFIVTLKHRTGQYLTDHHDATFRASSIQRASFKYIHYFHMRERIAVIDEFFARHPQYVSQFVSPADNVAFEAEPSSNSLLIKYRVLMMFNAFSTELPARKKREVYGINHRDPTPPSREEVFLEDLRSYASSISNQSFDGQPSGDLDFVNARSADFCPSEDTTTNGKLSWPKATIGSSVTSIPHCVTQDGRMLRRRCLGNQFIGGYWESLDQYESECVKTSTLFDQLYSSTWMLGELGSSRYLEMIRQSISGWNPNPAELELLTNSLFMLSIHMPDKVLNKEDVDNFNVILHQINSLDVKTLVQAQQSSAFSSDLSRATERFFARINMTTDQNGERNGSAVQRFNLELPFVAVTSWERFKEHKDDSVIGFTVSTNEDSIVQSDALFNSATFEKIQESNVTVLLPFQNNVNDREQVVFVAYPDSRLVDASAASGQFSSAVFMSESSYPQRWRQSDHLFTGNGGMIQVKLFPPPYQLKKPLTLFFRPRIPTTAENRHLLRCVFWDEKINFGNGGWSTDGCWLEGSRNGMEVCYCNHLSTFTLLVSRSEKELQSTVHGAILNFITLLGSSASILGLLLILATFAIFPSWRKPLGHKFLVQLSAALIILLITFLAGVDRVGNSEACRLTAIFLHYFLLATFCWMTIEAYHQYQRLVKVFGTYMPRFLLKATVLAWTVPSVPVIIVLIYDVDSYTGSEGYCWIRPTAFYFAVLAPVIILFLINLTLFVFVVRSIAASGRGLRTNQSESKQAKEKFVASLMNFILLGMSWIFGFFAVGPTNSVIFSYLFCLTTTFQGFFLFVLYVGRDPSARQLWLTRFGFGKLDSDSQKKSKATSSAGGNSSHGESHSASSTAVTESTSASVSSNPHERKNKGINKGVRQPNQNITTSV